MRLAASSLAAVALLSTANGAQTWTNVGLASNTGGHVIGANLVAFLVPESSEAGMDLNGDGDALDQVLHVYDALTGTTLDVGLPGLGMAVCGNRVAFAVSEAAQGADLNGDGDIEDQVLHLYDHYDMSVENLGLAVFNAQILFVGDTIAFAVPEGAQDSTDLNGDGDANDDVVHVHRLSEETTYDLGLQATHLSLAGGVLAFSVREGFQDNTDLNGDGDTSDEVLHVYDPLARSVTNVGVSLASASAFETDGDRVALFVNEQLVDLNADGDGLDSVLHVYDVSAGTLTNVAVASLFFGSGGVLALDGDFVAVPVSEANHGNFDLNGDGDANDRVLVVYNVAAGTLLPLGRAVPDSQMLADGVLAYMVSEADQGGLDLNGDGDALDRVMHVTLLPGGQTTNLGLAAETLLLERIRVAGGRVAFSVPEGGQGVDLNGDGDGIDSVVHVYDTATSTTTNLALSIVFVLTEFDLSERALAVLVSEAGQGGLDLNGNGSATDNVLVVRDFEGGGLHNTGLAGVGQSVELSGDFVAFPVQEASQPGGDLNGDADSFDRVLFTWDLDDCASAAATFRTAGANAISYTTGPLRLGDTLVAKVDLTTTGHAAAVVFAFDGSAEVPLAGGQVLLATNVAAGEIFAAAPAFAPVALFDIPVVNLPALCGRRIFSQAIHFGGQVPFALSNAQDLVFGY